MTDEGADMPAHIKLAIAALELMQREEMRAFHRDPGKTSAEVMDAHAQREAQIDQAIAMLRRVAG